MYLEIPRLPAASLLSPGPCEDTLLFHANRTSGNLIYFLWYMTGPYAWIPQHYLKKNSFLTIIKSNNYARAEHDYMSKII